MTGRVDHPTLAAHDAETGREHTQAEVGILAIGAPEALVEASDPLQRGTPVDHVRGRPAGLLETFDIALPIGGSSSRGQWYPDIALAA